MTIWRICFTCWMLKAADTHSKYVILLPFPQQQWLHERVWMLRYMYIACIVGLCIRQVFKNTHIWCCERPYRCSRAKGMAEAPVEVGLLSRTLQNLWFFSSDIHRLKIADSDKNSQRDGSRCTLWNILLNILLLTFWRRNYFFNFSTSCI